MALLTNYGLLIPCYINLHRQVQVGHRFNYCSGHEVRIDSTKHGTSTLINGKLSNYSYNSNMQDTSDIIRLQQAPDSAPIVKPPPDLGSILRFTEGILEMSRLQNYVPAMALVLVGGWMAGGRSVSVLLRSGQVWITAACSALISVASMLANDIFDFRSGTDHTNGKSNPLLRGQLHPHHVELVAGCLYGAAMIGMCYLEPLSLRLLIGGAAVATYIYTPLLKSLTMVKNVVVSGIISSSILAGAMAIGGPAQLRNPLVVAVALFFFLCILSRELLMDVEDMVGDKAAGVNTLAVRFGGRIGTLTASLSLAAANALLISLLAVRANAYAMIGTLSLLPLHAKMLRLCKEELGASKDTIIMKSIKQVVQQSMIHIGLGVLVLATAA